MNPQEKTLLEEISREYTDPDPGRLVDQKVLALIIRRLLSWINGPNVLELGFGDDQWTSQIIAKFGRSSLVEGSAALAQQARDRYGNQLTVYHDYFEEFTPPILFNTVVASFMLEHVEDPVLILRRAARWLAPGGRMLVVVPHADSLHRRLAVCMGLQATTDELGATDRQMGHRRVYTIARMNNDVTQAGFTVVRQKGLLTKSLPQRMLIQLSEAQLAGLVSLGESLPMEFAATIAFDCAPTGERIE